MNIKGLHDEPKYPYDSPPIPVDDTHGFLVEWQDDHDRTLILSTADMFVSLSNEKHIAWWPRNKDNTLGDGEPYRIIRPVKLASVQVIIPKGE